MATVNEKMTAIADAIRYYVPITEKLTLDDMASNIKEVYQALWDSFQDNGSRRNYEMAFAGISWKPDIFKPKHPMKPSNAVQMFYKATSLTCDIAEVADIDFSDAPSLLQTFQNFGGTRIGVLDIRKATNITNMIANCSNLVTIDKIIVGGNLPSTLGFSNCTKLKNVTTEGELVKSVNAGACPLTVISLKSIITALKDFTEDTTNRYKYTVTFLTSAFEELEAEGSTAEYNGVACTWAELVDNKKWNLVKA